MHFSEHFWGGGGGGGGGGGNKHFSESKENFKVVGLTEWLY